MTFVQHSLKEFIRDERAWRRALDQPRDLNTDTLTSNAHDTCWYLFHRGTTENARSLQFAERLRSPSLPHSCSRELSIRSSATSSQQDQVNEQFAQNTVAKSDRTITVIDMDSSDENIAHQRERTSHNKNKTNKASTPNRFAEHLRWNKSMRLTDNERANMDILHRLFARNLQRHFSQQRAKLIKNKISSNNKNDIENENMNKEESVTNEADRKRNEQNRSLSTKNNIKSNKHGKENEVETRNHKRVPKGSNVQTCEYLQEQEKEQNQERSESHHTWISNVINVAKTREEELKHNAQARQTTLTNMAIVNGYFNYYIRQLYQLEQVQRSNVVFHWRQELCKHYKQFYETLFLLLSEDEYNARHKLFSIYIHEHIAMMNLERESFAQVIGMSFDLFVAITKVQRTEDERRSSIITSEEEEMKKYAQLSYLYELNFVNDHLTRCARRESKLKRNAQKISQ